MQNSSAVQLTFLYIRKETEKEINFRDQIKELRLKYLITWDSSRTRRIILFKNLTSREFSDHILL